jgi:glutathione peroxidase
MGRIAVLRTARASGSPARRVPEDLAMTTLYDFTAKAIDGQEKPLSEYAGHPVLVVNTASKCGLTPQYKGLQALYDDLHGQGVEVLGFPCDQFAHQEPGDESAISEFCSINYGVTFPMFAKVDVNGDKTHPLYEWLRAQKKGFLSSRIKWNFTKFLVDGNGNVVKRYAPTTKPAKIQKDVEKLLTK